VTVDGYEGHLFNAHIQELKPDNTTAVIFVEELGEKLVVVCLVFTSTRCNVCCMYWLSTLCRKKMLLLCLAKTLTYMNRF